jgi:hypothetical protein
VPDVKIAVHTRGGEFGVEMSLPDDYSYGGGNTAQLNDLIDEAVARVKAALRNPRETP